MMLEDTVLVEREQSDKTPYSSSTCLLVEREYFGENVSGGGNRACKGPEMGPCLTSSGNRTEVSIITMKQVGGLVINQRDSQSLHHVRPLDFTLRKTGAVGRALAEELT